MAIDKALYAAPTGIEELIAQDDVQPIEIEIEDPESVSINVGDLEIEIEKEEDEEDFYRNIAEDLDNSLLAQQLLHKHELYQ